MEVIIILLLVIAVVVFAVLYFRALADIGGAARKQYERWRTEDVQRITDEQREIARREVRLLLAQQQDEMKSDFAEQEATIRRDAIGRSTAVTLGKVTEHIAPWIPAFPFNPKDARFIGSPVDMIVFDGAAAGDVQRIVFLEIKSGSGVLTTKQRQIRDAVRERRVEWQELKVAVDQSQRALPATAERLNA